MQIINDLEAEYKELVSFCKSLSTEDWRTSTAFFNWTPWDEIAHLCYFDERAKWALQDPSRFMEDAKTILATMMAGREISALTRDTYAHLEPDDLLETWQLQFESLLRSLRDHQGDTKIPWYGPPMSVNSFATARMMEVWAHGQDIYDSKTIHRPQHQRIKHIAQLASITYKWAFNNRSLAVPDRVPFLALSAPNGELWTWNEVSEQDYIRGSAYDFCLVATQRRHFSDVALTYKGEGASQWLPIMQCFAGPPADPPSPGLRHWC